jgi:type IV pilus assembly protein PilM
VVNAGRDGVTTAIVKAGVLLLHRTVDLGADLRADQQADQRNAAQQVNQQAKDAIPAPLASDEIKLPLVDRERTSEEWAQQEPLTLAEQNAVVAVETELIAQEVAQEIAEEIADAENASEVAQAVSVAAAYFEDTLESPPSVIHAAGTLGAAALTALLKEAHVGPLAVREMLHSEMLGAGAASAGTPGGVPLGWLAGVRGALAN